MTLPPHSMYLQWLFWFQGIYYGMTGIWPLVHVESFQWVTGRKTDHLVTGREADHWLVMTVGVLVVAIALSLLTAAWRRSRSAEVSVLAISAAVGLATIDVIYVMRAVLLPIYLVDAAIEIFLTIALVTAMIAAKTRERGS